jgi:hypothetical protein
MEKTEFKKYDTFATTTYLVRLAQNAKVFPRDDGGEDVVLTFCDNSRVDKTLDLWVDARVVKFQGERAKLFAKGDEVQVTGKLRIKEQKDGTVRGKIYDAVVNSFVNTKERAPASSEGNLFE